MATIRIVILVLVLGEQHERYSYSFPALTVPFLVAPTVALCPNSGSRAVWPYKPARVNRTEGGIMGSVVKKRRKKIRKHKYKKLRKKMRHQRK